MLIPELCVFTFMIIYGSLTHWCIYLIAFDKNNIFHKETLKQEIWYDFNKILHGNCMELDVQ